MLPKTPSLTPLARLHQILDLARWAPSGDNCQPWRFKILGDDLVQVKIDIQKPSVFDRESFATAMAGGALLASVRIAAQAFSCTALIDDGVVVPEQSITYTVQLNEEGKAEQSSLLSAITSRSVCRTPYERRALTDAEKKTLSDAVGPDFDLVWFEGRARWQVVKALCANEKIRTFIPEVFAEYRHVIDWKSKTSTDRMPGGSMGLDPFTVWFASIMFKSWPLYLLCNTVLGGYLLSLVKLDIVPGLFCGAHVAMLAKEPPRSLQDHVHAGEAMQRFWLTVTSLNLLHQPAIAPLTFTRYAGAGQVFSVHPKALNWAHRVRTRMSKLLGGSDRLDRTVWFGRVGEGEAGSGRSLRRPLEDLIEKGTKEEDGFDPSCSRMVG